MGAILFQAYGYAFNLQATLALLGGVTSLGAGFYVIVRERRAPESLYFFFLVLVVSVWLLSYGFMYAAPDADRALEWAEIAYFAIPVIPAAVYRFTIRVLRLEDERRLAAAAMWALAAAFVLAIHGGGLVLQDVALFPYGHSPVLGPATLALVAFLALGLGLSLGELWRVFREAAPGPRRRRIRWLMTGFGVGGLAVFDFAPVAGVGDPVVGAPAIILSTALLAWTIHHYRLVDLTPAFAAEQILETMADLLVVCDRDGRVRMVNPAVTRILEYPESELRGTPLERLFGPDPETRRRVVECRTGDGVRDEELVLRARSGRRIDVRLSSSPLRDEDGQRVGTVVIARDIRERKEAEEALRRSEEKFNRLFRVNPLPIGIATLEGDEFLEVNEAFEAFFGCSREEAERKGPLGLGIWVDPEDRRKVVERVRRTGAARGIEVPMRTREGAVHEVLLFGERAEVEGRPCLLALVLDITERKAAKRELERMALSDGLTGLANRSLFLDRLDHAVSRMDRRGTAVGVLFIDLDGFKRVNDTLGHTAGDRLLVVCARRIESAFRAEDTVARVGGDEFAVLLEELSGREDAELAAERLVRILEEPFELAEVPVDIRGSIGIALAEEPPERAEDLLRFADVAMYRAKVEAGTRYQIFDPAVDTVATRRLFRETRLREAIEGGEIRPVYQPIVSLRSGRILAVEALARWHHRDGSVLGPADFLSLAEETGFIIDLDRAVLESACRRLAAWRAASRPFEDLLVGVNLSSRTLYDPGLPDFLQELLGSCELPPHGLVLEVTERTVLRGQERMKVLRELGVRIAIDDFGTGYASLEYLKRLPADALKVDRTFTAGLPDEPGDRAIVEALVSLGRTLGLLAVAEGIETAAQLEALRRFRCPMGQGFLLGPPVPPEEFRRRYGEEGRVEMEPPSPESHLPGGGT